MKCLGLCLRVIVRVQTGFSLVPIVRVQISPLSLCLF
jgi:hypothetical protein